MENVEYRVEGSKLVIEVDLTQNLGPSKSGKSDFIANTGGFVKLPGSEVKFSLNVIVPRG
jgi:hypothetical protein